MLEKREAEEKSIGRKKGVYTFKGFYEWLSNIDIQTLPSHKFENEFTLLFDEEI